VTSATVAVTQSAERSRRREMTRTTSAAVLREAGGEYAIEPVELDDLRPGEVYVRIEASGLCHTDVTMQHVVPMPAVIGHEGAGVVEEVGPGVDYVKPGDRVIVSWPACGICPNCVTGKRYICDDQFGLLFRGTRSDGSKTIRWNGELISGAFFQQSSFATHALARAEALVKVEDDVPSEILAALPCGVMTGAGSVLNAMEVGAQDDLVVFGAGGVGLSGVMAGRVTGADPIIAVDINAERLALALELGATHAVDASKEDVVAQIMKIVPGGVHKVLDASGAAEAWKAAGQILRYGGTFGEAGVPMGDTLAGHPPDMFSKAVRVQFIMAGFAVPRLFLPQLIKWYKQGRFPVDRLVTTFPFAQINKAFAEAHAGKAVKPVLMM
jgi:aryl-alcohol dehydrogenase